ncbi:MAG: hypothetical protein V4564_09195 [Pseudomonadota bacterium]|uniref:hypothetical protein n=1 Tax=Sphingomonas sp. ERG5 TaxID=1381597 RepID=UPI00054B0869|nr:hypothetical protein [Sphingomonas sp. ERG5]
MHWCRTAPVQDVGALIVIGAGVVDRVLDTLAFKSAVFATLQVDHGADWLAVFAVPLAGAGTELMLPRLADAIALYEEVPGWWLPVGTEIGVPAHVRPALRRALCDAHDVDPPAIVVPRFTGPAAHADRADIFIVRDPRPFSSFDARAPGRRWTVPA